MRALLATLVLVGCAHTSARTVCEIDKLPQNMQGRAVEISAALLSSPTWAVDLRELASTLGEDKVSCLVRATVEALMQVANRATDDSFVVAPNLAIGVERGREWLKSGSQHANACAGK